VGSHPEYATAECSTLAELLAQDRAGDLVMAELAAAATRRGAGRIALFKNNSDSHGHGFGSHENYQVPRSGSAALAARLIPFLVTRQLVAGAGGVQVTPRGARYVLSPRADQISEALSSATTRARPMINTRDEPLADGDKHRRLHVIVGDSNMAEPATRFKVGATKLVLRAARRGLRLPDMELADPPAAIREVSHGWRDAHPVELKAGGRVEPAAIQREYLQAVRAVAEGPEEADVIVLWEKALTAWETREFDGLETQLDWLAKLRLLERYRERTGARLADPRVARLELAYHQLGPEGLRPKLEASGLLARVISPEAAARAVTEPPGTTRARLRGEFVRAARAAGREHQAEWTRLRLEESKPVETPDPLDNRLAAAEDLIRALRAAPRRGTVLEFDSVLERAAGGGEG
jgi:proteasome accessory factor A